MNTTIKTSRILTLILGLGINVFLTSHSFAKENTAEELRVCLYPGFAPFAEKKSDGKWYGWDVTYLQAFARHIHKKFIPVEMTDFKGIWMGPSRGLCDIAATGISDLPQRRAETGEGGVWSQHYYQVVRAFLVKESDKNNLLNQDWMIGKTVIVTENSTAHLDLINRLSAAERAQVKLEFTTNEEASALRVKNGTGQEAAFAYGGGLGSLQYLASKLGGLSVVWPHCFMKVDHQQESEPFSFVVRANSPELVKQLNRYIEHPDSQYQGGKGPDLQCPVN